MGPESHLLDVLRVDAHLMKPYTKVQLREDLCTGKLIEELLHGRYGEPVLNNYCVQCAVIDTEPLAAIAFLDEKDRDGVRARAGSDDPLCDYLPNELFNLRLLEIRVTVWFNINGDHTWRQGDAMI